MKNHLLISPANKLLLKEVNILMMKNNNNNSNLLKLLKLKLKEANKKLILIIAMKSIILKREILKAKEALNLNIKEKLAA
jgi:hypothetical protein